MRLSSVYSILLATVVTIPFSFSAEVDQFTSRGESLVDSSGLLNKVANENVQSALAKLKNENSGCNEIKLYAGLRTYFHNHSKGEFTKYVLHSEEVNKRRFKIQDSVYRDWNVWDGYLLGKSSANASPLALSAVIKVGDIEIGADKFEHMFGRGFAYFTNHYLMGKSIEKTLKSGIFGEKTILGGNKLATGVFSYGDLAANFNGMRFWNHILNKNDDILGESYNLGPYIACENNQWVQVKEIDFRNYVDDSFDESINCSKFPTNKTKEKFLNNVHALAMSCPMDNHLSQNLISKYGKLSKWIINQEENGVVKYLGEFRGK